MDPRWLQLARRNWQALAALLVFLVFAGAHAAAFRPALVRYRKDVRRAVELGMPIEATGAPPVASVRIGALLDGNSLNASVAEEQGASGVLTAGLLDEVTRLVARAGLEVLTTEQGLVTQLPTSVQVRAHLKLRGSYPAFVGLVGGLARSGSLLALDRFTVQGGAGAERDIEVWVSQLILKRTPGPR